MRGNVPSVSAGSTTMCRQGAAIAPTLPLPGRSHAYAPKPRDLRMLRQKGPRDLLVSEIASQRAVENVPEQTMGYDARDYGNDFAEHWPEERRNDFLYRMDVHKVLSVDTTVWPSIFTELRESLPVHLESLALGDLWAEERALQKAVSQKAERGPVPMFRTIRVTLALDGAETRHPASGALTKTMEMPSQGGEWQFVGFDVADAYLLSALTNCGFLPGQDKAEALRREWAPHLNEFHLFAELSAASAFRRFSDVRLASDHAPTFVYGIHILELKQ